MTITNEQLNEIRKWVQDYIHSPHIEDKIVSLIEEVKASRLVIGSLLDEPKPDCICDSCKMARAHKARFFP